MVNYIQVLGQKDQRQEVGSKQCVFGLKLVTLAFKTGQGNHIVKDASSGMLTMIMNLGVIIHALILWFIVPDLFL